MEKKLKRDTSDKMVAGVASGLANYFELDVTWVRIAFALATFFGGSGIWVYIILWIAVPEQKISPFNYTDYRVNTDDPLNENFGSTFKPKRNKNVNAFAGFILIALGFYFLMSEFDLLPYWFHVRKLWPLVFVLIGLSIIFKNKNKKTVEEPIIEGKPFEENPLEEEPKAEDNQSINNQENNNL
jgi:phage shock protein C